jgi:hypothetical protein
MFAVATKSMLSDTAKTIQSSVPVMSSA